MNELQIFQNTEFGELRVLEQNGKPYFPATACAKALGYVNTKDAIIRHCKGVVKHDLPTNGGVQAVNFIPEGDLYRLITHSKLPSAERFEAWVFDEVLPTIRRTGGYGTPAPVMEQLAEQLAQATAALAQLAALIATPPIQEPEYEPPADEDDVSGRHYCKHRKKTRQSKLWRMDTGLRQRVDEMICSGDYTYAEVTEYICGSGFRVSKSAVGRYAKLLDE